jgi:uncharacterized BrkB/YihY/UPF0761 family membrane protein
VPNDPKSIPDVVQELWELLKAYAQQETIDPLRGLGRYLGFGLVGAALLALGVFFLAMSALRVLQEKTGDAFTGWRSALPYLIVVVLVAAIAGIAASRIPKGNPKSSPGKGGRR